MSSRALAFSAYRRSRSALVASARALVAPVMTVPLRADGFAPRLAVNLRIVAVAACAQAWREQLVRVRAWHGLRWRSQECGVVQAFLHVQ